MHSLANTMTSGNGMEEKQIARELRAPGPPGLREPARGPDEGATEPVPATILLVDDSRDQLRILTQLLRSEGYQVLAAESGEAAIEIAVSHAPELVILDVRMPPGMDGFDACRRLHEVCDPAPSVLFLSAHAATANIVRGLDLGGIDYLAKPYDVDHLIARIRSAIRARQHFESLRSQVAIDALTGLLNRAELNSRGTELMALCERHDLTFCCLTIDVDRFKLINDTHGHLMGDSVLREIAARLREVSRQADTPFRLGGDEFLLLAPESTPNTALALADRLRAAIADEPFTLPGANGAGVREQVTVTVSVGVASWRPGSLLKDILHEADAALYAAKRAGRNQSTAARQP